MRIFVVLPSHSRQILEKYESVYIFIAQSFVCTPVISCVMEHHWYDFELFPLSQNIYTYNATTCSLWTSWSPLPVVAEV
jgi:hypothetical protein